ncbi:hypothetical protein CsSME_00006341 [Camellia sinensis var. sinensis]
MPLSTSFPSDVNEKTQLQGVDTHMTPINDIGQMACDVDLMAGINQNTGTTALQNSLVRNIKKKNKKEHNLPKYEYPLVLGRQMKPSDSGVVNGGEYDSKQEMEDEIIELLSTQEKNKLKEAYEKEGNSAQVWTGPHVTNSVSFNDIRAIKSYFENYINHKLKVGTVKTQDLVKELLVVDYCPQQKLDSNDYGIIVCFIMKQLVRHLHVDKSMGGESCRTMRAGMVKLFVNDRRRSFVVGN